MGANIKVVWKTVQEDLLTLETLIIEMKKQLERTSDSG